jgi:TusA-related sulfurtransferase
LQDLHYDLELDLEGLLCPIPVVKLSVAIKEIDPDGVIRATATDPGVMADIPAWCKATGNELMEMTRDEGVVTFWVRKAA